MKFVSNAGTDRVVDLVRPWLRPNHRLDVVSPSFSLFAFAEILADAPRLFNARLVVPPPPPQQTPHPAPLQIPLLGGQNETAPTKKTKKARAGPDVLNS